jgi:hypothetical protein
MNAEQTASLLAAIARRQAGERHPAIGNDTGTAPVELSIGYIGKTRMVMHDGVVIIDCPPAIIDVINRWVDEQHKDNEVCGIHVEAGSGGMIIR